MRVGRELIMKDNTHGYTDFHDLTPSVDAGLTTPEVVAESYVIDYTSPTFNPLTMDEDGGFSYRYVYGLDKLSVKITSEGTNWWGQHVTTDILKDYYHQDRLGSTTNLTDQFGRVVGRADYNEWGEITYREALDITSSYRRIWPQSSYTGHDWDDVLGMYYAKARFYSAEDKRFVAMDPVKGSITDPLSLVPYVYCVDNPLRWVDPMGLRLECLDVFGGGKAVSPKNGKNQTAKDQMETAQRANIVLPTQDISAGIGQDVHQSDVKMMVAMPVPIMPVVPFHSIGPKFNSPSISPWQGAGIVPQRENGWYYIAKGIIQPIQDAVNKFWDWAFSKKYEVKRTPSDFASRFGCPEADEAAEESETPDDTQTPVAVAGTPGGPKKGDDDDKRDWVKVNEKYLEKQLEKQNTDPHQVKQEYLGKRAEIKKYDIYKDKGTGQLGIFEKATGKCVEITDYFID